MSVRGLPSPDYRGESGLAHLRALGQALRAALAAGDWQQVQRLDRSCAQLVERVIDATRGRASPALASALRDLKQVYQALILHSSPVQSGSKSVCR